MAITTKQQRQQRRNEALQLIADGVPPTDAATQLSQTWGCSRRTSLRDIELAQGELANALNSVELQHMVGWLATQYQRLAAKAERDGQYAAACGCLPTERQHHTAATTVFCAVSELATAGQSAIGALMAADVPAQADFSLDVLPQALGPLLTRPKFWHLLGAALCALVCAKTWIQATTSDYICAQG